eukprot:jgi/Bigna1/88999/estExt_fgenesh1_pg.C_420043
MAAALRAARSFLLARLATPRLIISAGKRRRMIPPIILAGAITSWAATHEKTSAKQAFPVFTEEDVSRHDGKSHPEMWVSFQGHVYDITDFVREHPGGKMIIDAVGGPLEPYWGYWAYHLKVKKPREWLAKFRIGKLQLAESVEEGEEGTTALVDLETNELDFYTDDPHRDQMVHDVIIDRPFCSQSRPEVLGNARITKADDLYVRNHAPVPHVDPDTHKIAIEGHDGTVFAAVGLAEIFGRREGKRERDQSSSSSSSSKYPRVAFESVIQCAGNRASEMIASHERKAQPIFKNHPFEKISIGMMGNVEWSGVLLADILEDVVPGVSKMQGMHVVFSGVDGYETSTPIERILDRSCGAILADKINGKPRRIEAEYVLMMIDVAADTMGWLIRPLPLDHGYPVRVFLPGIAGARSVKWLHNIRLSPRECESTWQRNYYKEAGGRQSIQELPHQSLILSHHLPVDKSSIELGGIAWGGGSGERVSRVEVSLDDGATWVPARLQNHSGKPGREGDECKSSLQQGQQPLSGGKHWGWSQWRASVPLANNSQSNNNGTSTQAQPKLYEVMCRSFDSNGVCQPRAPWNPKGYLYNGWHTIRLPATAAANETSKQF